MAGVSAPTRILQSPPASTSTPAVAASALDDALARGMAAVDRCIQETLRSKVALVEQVANYIIHSGGKRLRPRLVLMVDEAIRQAEGAAQGHPEAIRLATVVEFIHTATLLHDDVVDESGLRRNRETANAIFGNAASVLVGDFLYSRAFQVMVDIGSMPVMQTLAEATNVIAEGEVLQLVNCGDPDVTEERYLEVIRFKTAKLFEAACALPAVVRNLPPATCEAYAAYGRHLGTAFQITDDLLDYEGDAAAMGKNVGDDLREGKPTLPLLYAMQAANTADRAMIRQAIAEPESVPLSRVLETIRQSDALARTRLAAEREVALAQQALASTAEGSVRASLLDLASLVLSRNQ